MTDTERDAQLDRRLRRLQAGLLLALDRLSGRFIAGALTVDEFQAEARKLLRNAHARAAYLGRVRAGERKPFSFADTVEGARAERAELSFLAGFIADLRAGRYDRKTNGGRGAKVRKARWALYALKLAGTANAAWLLLQGRDALITWHLGAVERHCGDCPGLAAGSPYTRATLPTTPGSGGTKCLVNCACYLTSDTGGRSFRAGSRGA